jgi:hypothetical protein
MRHLRERVCACAGHRLMLLCTDGWYASVRASVETCRERLAAVTGCGRALARPTRPLPHGMYMSGTVFNCCPLHASLAHVGRGTTPAMAAGITEHCWTVAELLSLPMLPLRWSPFRPVRASLAGPVTLAGTVVLVSTINFRAIGFAGCRASGKAVTASSCVG